jgi:hypothetical protein
VPIPQAAVVIVEFGAVDPASWYGELVVQNNDLEVLQAARADSEASERCEESAEDAVHKASASAAIIAGQRPQPSIRHPQVGLVSSRD